MPITVTNNNAVVGISKEVNTIKVGMASAFDASSLALQAASEAENFSVLAEASADSAALYTPAYYPNMAALLADDTVWPVGTRLNTRTDEVLDVFASGAGDFNHPVSGIGLRVVPDNQNHYSITAFGAVDTISDPDSNIREPLIAAIIAARRTSGFAYIPSGVWELSGNTVAISAGDVRIKLQEGAKVYTSPEDFSTYGDFSNTLYGAFSLTMDGSSATDESATSVLHLEGGEWINFDTTTKTGFINAYNDMGELVVKNVTLRNYSQAIRAGRSVAVDGVHTGSDPLTSIHRTRIENLNVYGDGQNAGQCAAGWQLFNAYDVHISKCSIRSPGNGYCTRIGGGEFDAIPRAGHGAGNIRIIGNYFYSEMDGTEYNQIAKARDVVISNNTFDVSNGTTPHNFFDLFNVQNVTFTGNSGVGGGLLFCGHADLGNSSYQSNLVGSGPVTAVGNTITNPTHYHIFNFGGDGTSGGNRAIRDVVCANNTVIVEDGFSLPSPICFLVYAFITNGLVIEGNSVNGITGLFREYYCRNVTIGTNNIKVGAYPFEEYRRDKGDKSFVVSGDQSHSEGATVGKLIDNGSARLTSPLQEYFFKSYVSGVPPSATSALTVGDLMTYEVFASTSRYSNQNGFAKFTISKFGTAQNIIADPGNTSGFTCSIDVDGHINVSYAYSAAIRGCFRRVA